MQDPVVSTDRHSQTDVAFTAALPADAASVELVHANLEGGFERLVAALDRPADLIWGSASVHHLADQQAFSILPNRPGWASAGTCTGSRLAASTSASARADPDASS
jgi:hypothetical protein